MSIHNHTYTVKSIARELGFDYCGISKAEFLAEEAPRLERWLTLQMHGTMHYMEKHFDKRLNPTLLVEGAQSVISLLYNYTPEQTLPDTQGYKISKYAYGEDYHHVIKHKLHQMVARMQERIGHIHAKVFVDSAPVLDKSWAKKSGLGWLGKHTNLINRKIGSYFFIAEIICDVALTPDGPIPDYCGTCTRCIDACPTDAIVQPYVVDGSKCISYLTIELKDTMAIPESFKQKMDNWVFGCDICQDVCPWNKFAIPTQELAFKPSEQLINMNKNDWENLEQEAFSKLFKKSAVKRAKLKGLRRNIQFAAQPL